MHGHQRIGKHADHPLPSPNIVYSLAELPYSDGALAVWSIYGAKRAQPAATNGKRSELRNPSNKPKPLPRVATGCRSKRKARRVCGSSPQEGFRKGARLLAADA